MVKSFCDSCKTSISNVYFIRIFSRISKFVRVANHSSFSVVQFYLVVILHFVHSNSLPSAIRPQDLIYGAKKNLNIILHGSSTNPISNSIIMSFLCLMPLFLGSFCTLENIFDILNTISNNWYWILATSTLRWIHSWRDILICRLLFRNIKIYIKNTSSYWVWLRWSIIVGLLEISVSWEVFWIKNIKLLLLLLLQEFIAWNFILERRIKQISIRFWRLFITKAVPCISTTWLSNITLLILVFIIFIRLFIIVIPEQICEYLFLSFWLLLLYSRLFFLILIRVLLVIGWWSLKYWWLLLLPLLLLFWAAAIATEIPTKLVKDTCNIRETKTWILFLRLLLLMLLVLLLRLRSFPLMSWTITTT